jgi:hypothetical protein
MAIELGHIVRGQRAAQSAAPNTPIAFGHLKERSQLRCGPNISAVSAFDLDQMLPCCPLWIIGAFYVDGIGERARGQIVAQKLHAAEYRRLPLNSGGEME